jgi:hypothetical protein
MMKVAPGVPVLRRITAAHVSTRHAHPEMNPNVSNFHAVFADVDICVSDFDAVQVRALRCHMTSPSKWILPGSMLSGDPVVGREILNCPFPTETADSTILFSSEGSRPGVVHAGTVDVRHAGLDLRGKA